MHQEEAKQWEVAFKDLYEKLCPFIEEVEASSLKYRIVRYKTKPSGEIDNKNIQIISDNIDGSSTREEV